MKRVSVLFLCMTVVISFFAGCSSAAPDRQAAETVPAATTSPTEAEVTEQTQATEETGIPDAASNDFRIALIAMDQIDPYWSSLEEGAMKAAEELGCEMENLSPVMKDAALQTAQIEEAVSSGFDGIVIAASDPEAIAPALEEAMASGIRVVCVDTAAEIDADAFFFTDNRSAGKTAGEAMLVELEARDITEGTIGIVGIHADADFALQRETGFREAFEGTGFTVLETRYGEGDAARSLEIAEDYVRENVVGIFGCCEGALIGCGNAVEETGAETIVVGFDQSDLIRELIEKGIVQAAVVQNPDVMGYEGMKAVCAALNGVDLKGAVMDTGVSVLTR